VSKRLIREKKRARIPNVCQPRERGRVFKGGFFPSEGGGEDGKHGVVSQDQSSIREKKRTFFCERAKKRSLFFHAKLGEKSDASKRKGKRKSSSRYHHLSPRGGGEKRKNILLFPFPSSEAKKKRIEATMEGGKGGRALRLFQHPNEGERGRRRVFPVPTGGRGKGRMGSGKNLPRSTIVRGKKPSSSP